MSFVQVRERGASSGASLGDRTPFYGAKLPEEIKKLVKLSKSVDHATVRKVLKRTCTFPSRDRELICRQRRFVVKLGDSICLAVSYFV